MHGLRLPLVVAFVFLPWLSARAADFNRDVAPVLVKRCLECHSGAEASGNLNLTSAKAIGEGGDSGPPIAAGKPGDSLLFRRIEAGEMPPAKQGKSQRLSREEVATLREWIASGAAWPQGRVLDPYEMTTDKRGGRDWWSLQGVRRPKIPAAARRASRRQPDVRDVGNPIDANPIDAFVLHELETRGWTPAPPADKRTLIRRVYFDLIGLPPTFEEVEAFVRDDSPDAYEQLIDRAARVAALRRALGPSLARRRPLRRDVRLRARPGEAERLEVPRLGHRTPSTTTCRTTASSSSSSPATSCRTAASRPSSPRASSGWAPGTTSRTTRTSTSTTGSKTWCTATEHGVPRADGEVRPLPRPQVRPDPQTDYYRMASAFWAGLRRAAAARPARRAGREEARLRRARLDRPRPRRAAAAAA